MTRPPRIAREVAVKRTPSERARRSVPGHLKWIRTLPCIHCGYETGQYGLGTYVVEAAHVRRGTDGGTSLKPHDRWTVPLCRDCHGVQHQVGEVTFWAMTGVDPVSLAEHLWRHSGDTDKAIRAIERARMTATLREREQ